MIKSHFTRGTQFTVKLFTIGLILGLVACGGDDDKKPTPTPTPTPIPTPDVTPNTFTFDPVTDAALSTEFVSNTVTISDIDELVPISISGGEYSVDSGSFTNSAGQVNDGQTVTVRVTSSNEFSTKVSAMLTVGSGTTSVSDTFSVTTLAQDTAPDVLVFSEFSEATLSKEYTSNEATIAGINSPARIESITGGSFSIVGTTDFISTIGAEDNYLVSNGDRIQLRTTSSAELEQTSTVTIVIGGVSSSYSVTTQADTTPPVATLHFPSFISATYRDSLIVRGATEDDFSSITAVTINGETVSTSDNFATWEITVPLATGENPINVVTIDAEGNTSQPTLLSTVTRQTDFSGAFPAGLGIANMSALAPLDEKMDLLAIAEYDRNIYTYNTLTGEIAMLSPAPNPELHSVDEHGYNFSLMSFDDGSGLKLLTGYNGLSYVNLETGERTLLSGENTPDTDLPYAVFGRNFYINLPEQVPFLLTYYLEQQMGGSVSYGTLIRIDPVTGEKSIFSDPTDPSFGEVYDFPIRGMDVDLDSEQIYILGTSGDLLSVNLRTQMRERIADADTPNPGIGLDGFVVNIPESNILYCLGRGDDDERISVSLDESNYGFKTELASYNLPGFSSITAFDDLYDAEKQVIYIVNPVPGRIGLIDTVNHEAVLIMKAANQF